MRILTEYRLTVSADMPQDDLVRNLVMLAEAGLQGMVTETLRFEVDGEPIGDIETSGSPDPTPLRPPTDPRIETAARELRVLSRKLDVALGWRSGGDSETLEERPGREMG